jgi:8-oxo-dGTP diphosphatase
MALSPTTEFAVSVIELHVVAAVISDGTGRVLIAQRPPGRTHAGWWEFPGGKRNIGETEPACLARELREELGIEIDAAASVRMMQLSHRYPDRLVNLSVWKVEKFSGSPKSLEGQALRWVFPAELESVQLLPADGPIVESLLRGA